MSTRSSSGTSSARARCVVAPLAALVLSSSLAACATDAGEPSLGTGAEALTRTVTIRRGTFAGVADTYVSASAMKKNFGAQKKLVVSAHNEALLRFDLTSIPDNAVIDAATLIVTINGGQEEDDDDCDDGDHEGHPIAPIKLRRVTAPWAEDTVTYRSFHQQFAPPVVGTIVLANRSSTKTVDVRALVQGWVAGTYPNHGLVLTTAGRQHTLIVASEQAQPGRRPTLEVRYTTPDDHCAAGPCVHGACTNQAAGFTCACEPGWEGATCADDIDDCAGAPCQHGGVCTDQLGGYACACAPGYGGANCETNLDDCAAGPCVNGGVCTDGVDDFTCACPAGWGGETCAVDLDECADQPCQHGGACTDGAGGFTCACAPGFGGALCELDVDECAGVVCGNGGSCADGVNQFTCNCPAGFAGTFCEQDLDDCIANACGHGACVDRVDGYTCACEPGFTGPTCEVDVDDCAGSPCANGGQCVDGIDGYTCACAAGYSGAQCETNVDDCAAEACVHGTCVDGTGSYRCECELGYGDQFCQSLVCPLGFFPFNGVCFECSAMPSPPAVCALSALSCLPGTGPTPDYEACELCPSRWYGDGTGPCQPCPTGMGSPPDRTSCAPLSVAITAQLPTTAVAGQPFEVSARVEELPGHEPLAGREVVFLLTDPVAPVVLTTFTGADGVARADFTAPAAGDFTLRAVTIGTVSPYVDGPLAVSRASTALAPVQVPPAASNGMPMEVSTVLTRTTAPAGPIAGAPVRFRVAGYAPTVIGITDATGRARAALPAPPWRGPATAVATFEGTAGAVSSTASAPFTVYRPVRLVILSVQPTLVEAYLSGLEEGGGQIVTFDGVGDAPVAAVTDPTGVARAAVTLPPGTSTVTASFFNPGDYYGREDGVVAPSTAWRVYPDPCAAGFELAGDRTTCVAMPSGPQSSAVGAGLLTATVGIPTLFTVIVRDAHGVQLDHGIGCARITAAITGTSYIAPACTDNGDGTITFIYTPFIYGNYALTIMLDGHHIQNSPFALAVY